MNIADIAAATTLGLALYHAGRWILRRAIARLRRPPERGEECTCGLRVPISRAHLVIATYADEEMGGGTAVSAAFCKACCPGGCTRSKEHR